jgi:hypothetical protein
LNRVFALSKGENKVIASRGRRASASGG